MTEEIIEAIKALSRELPKFPDGRIDYTHAKKAAVINVWVVFGGKFLLMKRGQKVMAYRGFWGPVAGFLDEIKPVREKAMEELREETGIQENLILSIELGKAFTKKDADLGREWIICPVLARLRELPEIKMDWEHTEFAWVRKEEFGKFDLMPGVWQALENMEAFF